MSLEDLISEHKEARTQRRSSPRAEFFSDASCETGLASRVQPLVKLTRAPFRLLTSWTGLAVLRVGLSPHSMGALSIGI